MRGSSEDEMGAGTVLYNLDLEGGKKKRTKQKCLFTCVNYEANDISTESTIVH